MGHRASLSLVAGSFEKETKMAPRDYDDDDKQWPGGDDFDFDNLRPRNNLTREMVGQRRADMRTGLESTRRLDRSEPTDSPIGRGRRR